MEVTLDLVESLNDDFEEVATGIPTPVSYLSPLMEWSDESAWSHREEVEIQPGLKLFTEQVKSPGPTHRFTINRSPLEFGILISGNCKCRFKNKFGINSGFHLNSGTNMISYMPGSSGLEEYSNCPLITVSIHIDPEMAKDYLGMGIQDDSLPSELMDIIDGNLRKPYYHFSSLNSNLRMIAEQILSCSLSGRLRRMFLEGKAMELLAFQLDHLCQRQVVPVLLLHHAMKRK